MKKLLVFLAAMSLVFGLVGVASANLITHGSFENPDDPDVNFLTLYDYVDPLAIPGWEVIGSVDWIRNYWPASDGNWSLDLAGDSPGFVESNPFPTTPGQWYTVEFDMAGNPDQEYDKALLGVAVGSDLLYLDEFIFEQSLGSFSDMGWQTKSFDFQADDLATILFFGDTTLGGGPWGAAIDNVRVAPVPEPATMLLLGSGLIGLVGLGRKKFFKRG